MAPSTGEETTGDSECWPTCVNPLLSNYLQGVEMLFEVKPTYLKVSKISASDFSLVLYSYPLCLSYFAKFLPQITFPQSLSFLCNSRFHAV